MRTTFAAFAALLLLCLAPVFAHAQPVTATANLNTEGARLVMAAALSYAKSHGAPGSAIAVVDITGALVLFERLDGTFPVASRVSQGKAQTAAMFRKNTKFFEDVVNNGRTTMVALSDFTPLQGGVLLTYEGQVVGAIGVSGAASAQQDEEIALAGAAALAAAKP